MEAHDVRVREERGVGQLSTKNVMSLLPPVRYTFHRFSFADISDGIIRIRPTERKTARYIADFMNPKNRLA